MSDRSATERVLIRLGNFSLRVAQNRTIRGITDGFVNLIPLVLIGSICIALSNLPVPAFRDFLNTITGDNWTLISNILVFSTEHIISLAALLSISYTLAAQNRFLRRREINSFIPMFTAFSCYVILAVWDPLSFLTTPAGQSPEVHFGNPGQNGVFIALFAAVASTKLFIAFAALWRKLPWFRQQIIGSYSSMRTTLHTVIPIFLTMLCFVALRLLVDWLNNLFSIEDAMGALLTTLAYDGSFLSVLIVTALMQVLWFFGVHGTYTIQTFMRHSESGVISDTAQAAVTESLGSSTMFTSWDFYGTFVEMGGAGTTIALLLALLIFGSIGKGKRLARISAFPVAFNINETLLFGVPVVFNPLLFIPFVLAPLIVATVAYGALSLGIVPPLINSVEWTTPILFSGYLSTGSIAGALLQLVCIGLAFLVYTPFIVIANKSTERYQLELFDHFKKAASEAAQNSNLSVARRRDEMGEMARDFITDIHRAFDGKQPPFFLVYQPKVDERGRVAGAEALVRWRHPLYGHVPPDVLIELADEANLSTIMGRWITTEALEELGRWQQRGLSQLVLSINLNPNHIFEDDEFPEYLNEELERLALDPTLVDLEITERIAVSSNNEMLRLFHRLRGLGVHLSIDDMGMGYSSLTYISNFGASVVKLDVSLINQVATDTTQQEIVRSVVDLAQQIDLVVIVEGVESLEQVKTLSALGCHYYQGYYFSRPLSPEDFFAYADEHGTTLLLHEGAESQEASDGLL